MIYDDKEYTKEPAPSFRAWDDACKGCAFVNDQTACKNSYDPYNQETYCQICGKSFIFKECQKDDTKGV